MINTSSSDRLLNELFPFQVRIPNLILGRFSEIITIPDLKLFLENKHLEEEKELSKKVKTTFVDHDHKESPQRVGNLHSKSDVKPKSVLKKNQQPEPNNKEGKSNSHQKLSLDHPSLESNAKNPISPRSPDKSLSKLSKKSAEIQNNDSSRGLKPNNDHQINLSDAKPHYYLKEEIDQEGSQDISINHKANHKKSSHQIQDGRNDDLGK